MKRLEDILKNLRSGRRDGHDMRLLLIETCEVRKMVLEDSLNVEKEGRKLEQMNWDGQGIPNFIKQHFVYHTKMASSAEAHTISKKDDQLLRIPATPNLNYPK
jgi:hypothetical protein